MALLNLTEQSADDTDRYKTFSKGVTTTLRNFNDWQSANLQHTASNKMVSKPRSSRTARASTNQ